MTVLDKTDVGEAMLRSLTTDKLANSEVNVVEALDAISRSNWEIAESIDRLGGALYAIADAISQKH